MAKQEKQSPWNNIRPGRHSAAELHHLTSPLGIDAAETPQFSPDECVEKDLKGRGTNQASRRGPHGGEYARNERRGA